MKLFCLTCQPHVDGFFKVMVPYFNGIDEGFQTSQSEHESMHIWQKGSLRNIGTWCVKWPKRDPLASGLAKVAVDGDVFRLFWLWEPIHTLSMSTKDSATRNTCCFFLLKWLLGVRSLQNARYCGQMLINLRSWLVLSTVNYQYVSVYWGP